MIYLFKITKLFSKLSPQEALNKLVGNTQEMPKFLGLALRPIDINFSRIKNNNFIITRYNKIPWSSFIFTRKNEFTLSGRVQLAEMGSVIKIRFSIVLEIFLFILFIIMLIGAFRAPQFIFFAVCLGGATSLSLIWRNKRAKQMIEFLKQIFEASE